MERPRPRPKHRGVASKRRSIPSNVITVNKESLSRPRRSLSSIRTMRHRNSRSSAPTKNKRKSVGMLEARSAESKKTPSISDDDDDDDDMTKDDLLQKLTKIKQHQTSRKSDFGKDLDEIKQFIFSQKSIPNKNPSIGASKSYTNDNDKKQQNRYDDNNNNNNNNTNNIQNIHNIDNIHNIHNKHDALPTSLKLIGIRDPKSLLYHRQYINKLQHHHRTQSSVVSPNKHNVNIINKTSKTGATSSINDKYSHLRSFSSIMGSGANRNDKTDETKEDHINKARNQSISYVENAKNRKPSEIFSNHFNLNNNNNKKITTLQQLADEYESDSDDEQNQDDDIKNDQ